MRALLLFVTLLALAGCDRTHVGTDPEERANDPVTGGEDVPPGQDTADIPRPGGEPQVTVDLEERRQDD